MQISANRTGKVMPLTNSSVRILVIDDNRTSQHVLQQSLKEGGYCYCQVVESAEDIQEVLSQSPPHIVLLNWIMPKSSGLAVARMIREQDKVRRTRTYILMITGKDDTESMMQAFQSGADDFIAKADVRTELLPRMQLALNLLNQFAEHQHHVNRLTQEVLHQKTLITLDPTTHLPTQRDLSVTLSKVMENAVARQHRISCAMIVIMNYKELKDRLPAHILKKIVAKTSHKISKLIRPSDYIARTGADEFTLLFQNLDVSASSTFDRIERNLDKMSTKTEFGYYTVHTRIACTELQTDAVVEVWNDGPIRRHLRNLISSDLPLIDRIRNLWPQDQIKDKITDAYLFTSFKDQ